MEHNERADELEREAEDAGEASDRLKQDIEEAESDWAARKSDSSVPGATEPDDE